MRTSVIDGRPLISVTHEWVGEPNASQSIKKIDGAEVARNLVINPDFNGEGLAGFRATYGDLTIEDSLLWYEATRSHGTAERLELSLFIDTPGEYTITLYVELPETVPNGRWNQFVGVEHETKHFDRTEGWAEYSTTFTVIEPGSKILRFYVPGIPIGETFPVDWALLTQGESITYFDGDTPEYRLTPPPPRELTHVRPALGWQHEGLGGGWAHHDPARITVGAQGVGLRGWRRHRLSRERLICRHLATPQRCGVSPELAEAHTECSRGRKICQPSFLPEGRPGYESRPRPVRRGERPNFRHWRMGNQNLESASRRRRPVDTFDHEHNVSVQRPWIAVQANSGHGANLPVAGAR